MPQLLLEIFSEEIPARMQQGAARDLERMVSDRLKAAGLTWEALNVFAGPRRLTLVIDGLPTAAEDRNEEVKGPKTSAPAQALEGFLRKTGLMPDQLVERDGVWFAEISSKGRQTTEVFAEAVDQIIRSFPWPKSMRWGTGSLRWVRPIKRVIALFDGAVVPFEIDGIHSGDVTEGHRFLGSGKPFAVKDFADYRAKLEKEYVLLDVADRKLRILEAAKAACAARGLALVDDDGLLDEVAGLAEWPTPILGDMDPQFLSLPPEVVRLSMKVHQKYFAVRDPSKDGLAPNFLVVANVEATDGGQALAAGNSRVLSARLNDARFFWDEDQKVGFDAWNDKLTGVTFHAKLGTLAERVDRIAALAREIAPLVGADADQAEQAARLSKADLASGMVSEFPELQGIMGGYYARLAGYPDAVADAVRDHYKPQGPGDSVPTAPVTVAVAIAEKLDTLVGFFAIDEKPTGSRDPYALRRAALGVSRMIRAANAPVGLRPVLNKAVALLNLANEFDRQVVVIEVLRFIFDRLKVSLRDDGARFDLIDAVFEDVRGEEVKVDDDISRVVRRVEALAAFLATDDGANLLAGYKRASNILKAEEKKGPLPEGAVATGLPNQPAEETALAFAAAAAATAVDAALETEDFAAAMTDLAALRGPVDAFFTGVMVNSDVAEERENRLKLLGQVRAVMGRVADFGQIAG
ncbi:glycine--tRNA ligase subunit beta [Brevundimonas sp.]|uniref:glycine--tRNA ligase subunit beta n=1 Tax=Brevundimonas sp. TaxID=1871086 RepID=UPI00289CEDD1|nr:glycine--tRNA ligase subunit beta [Brevundimonas sp.]